MGFIDLVRNEVGVRDDRALAEIVTSLASNVSPLALGAVWRARGQTRLLTERMLSFHFDDESRRKTIAQYLLTGHPTHQYSIARSEARQWLGTEFVPNIDDALEKKMWALYLDYRAHPKLDHPYNPNEVLGKGEQTDQEETRVFPRSALESVTENQLMAHAFRTRKRLKAVQVPQQGGGSSTPGVQELIEAEGWVEWPE